MRNIFLISKGERKMFCRNCGKEIDDRAYVCPNCGVKVKDELTEQRESRAAANSDADSGSKAGWGILSFLIPIVGLILFCMWKNERPKTASVCGKCALISVIISVVCIIFYVILVFAVFSAL